MRSNAEDELSLTQFILKLKEDEALNKVITEDDEPDAEKPKEFDDNRLGWYNNSVFDSESDSDEYTEEGDVFQDNDVVEDDVDITPENIDIEYYDVSKSFCCKFYSEQYVALWPLYENHRMIDEKNVDFEAYGRQNLTKFLKTRVILSTVAVVVPCTCKHIIELFKNLSSSIGDERSGKYGLVFVHDQFASLTRL